MGVAALIFVAGGPVALAVALLVCLSGLAWPSRASAGRADLDRAARLPGLALGAMVVSGVLSAARPFGEGAFGPFGWPAQLCALVALVAALTPVVTAPARRRPGGREATVPAPGEDG